MPRIKPERRQRKIRYGPRTVLMLLWGTDFDFLDGEPLDDAGLRAAWEDLREDLLARDPHEVCPALDPDAVERIPPGFRCWAWWRFDAPEFRRQVNPGPEIVAGCPMYFGRPQCYRGVPPDDMFESEPSYLIRLGLLTADEKRFMARLQLLIAEGLDDADTAVRLSISLDAVKAWSEALS